MKILCAESEYLLPDVRPPVTAVVCAQKTRTGSILFRQRLFIEDALCQMLFVERGVA